MAVVGHDGALVGREIIALIDADQQFVFAQAHIIAVFQLVLVVLAKGNLRAIDIRAVRAGIDQDVAASPKIDPYVFARQVTLWVG